jgi:hypothetical protein
MLMVTVMELELQKLKQSWMRREQQRAQLLHICGF